jgi:hypothetical protein
VIVIKVNVDKITKLIIFSVRFGLPEGRRGPAKARVAEAAGPPRVVILCHY